MRLLALLAVALAAVAAVVVLRPEGDRRAGGETAPRSAGRSGGRARGRSGERRVRAAPRRAAVAATVATRPRPGPSAPPAARADLAGCREATGRVIYVERRDPDGDGDAHYVLAGGNITGARPERHRRGPRTCARGGCRARATRSARPGPCSPAPSASVRSRRSSCTSAAGRRGVR